MSVVIITGVGGLIGTECAMFFSKLGFDIVGIDNNMRKKLLGGEASNANNLSNLFNIINNYICFDLDIRNQQKLSEVFAKHKKSIKLIVHTAAQPSHEWAAKDPLIDFSINATGTLNLLEMTRKYSPEAPFIFTSTNKVYGDTPNKLPLVEKETRWELDSNHKYFNGVDESMSIDNSMHSMYGVSKLSADLMVQEYGRYFGLKTVSFRGNCLSGPYHSGTELHGFLSYLMKCVLQNIKYTIYGHKGKQVRDVIHSEDLVKAFYEFYCNPKCGKIYNIGGGRRSNCSVLEAIDLCQNISGRKLEYVYSDEVRRGDHKWYISDYSLFSRDYPNWKIQKNINDILKEMYYISNS